MRSSVRLELDRATMTITNLIIVCCHGIWLGGPANGHDESEWLIADFQKSETPTFIEHIKAGLEALSHVPSSLLVFSGYVSTSHLTYKQLTGPL